MKENQSHEARRRAFIREHHPDCGGDAVAFIAGLRALDAEREQGSGPLPEVVVVRRRPWLVRKVTAVGRRLRYGPRPSRVSLPAAPEIHDRAGRERARTGPGWSTVLTVRLACWVPPAISGCLLAVAVSLVPEAGLGIRVLRASVMCPCWRCRPARR
jgi:hypothetical protein